MLISLGFAVSFSGCQEVNSRVQEQLDSIEQHAEDIDSAVNKGLDKVEDLDSTITAKSRQLKSLDSIVRKTGTRLDSIVTKGAEEVNRRLN